MPTSAKEVINHTHRQLLKNIPGFATTSRSETTEHNYSTCCAKKQIFKKRAHRAVDGSIALARGGWIPACAGMTEVAKGLEETAETRGAACFFVQSLRAAGGVRRLLQPPSPACGGEEGRALT